MSDDDSKYSEQEGWIQWFCSLDDFNILCEVDSEYIKDGFNLYGIREPIKMILSDKTPEDEDLEDQEFLELYQVAMDVYALIHARFITTNKGLAIMKERFLMGKFGHCPRLMCERQNVIPIGLSEVFLTCRVKFYCPRCEDIYSCKKKNISLDGVFFGTSFPHLLLLAYPELSPDPNTTHHNIYVPRIFGFKIFKKKGSKYCENNDKNKLTNGELKKTQPAALPQKEEYLNKVSSAKEKEEKEVNQFIKK